MLFLVIWFGENSTGNSGMVVDVRVELIMLDFHPCLMKTLCHSRVYDTCLLPLMYLDPNSVQSR
jgi:hypothetical protein